MTTELTVADVTDLVKSDVDTLIKKTMVMEQADCPVMHHFADGVYIREVRFPAGIVVVGHLHRAEHMNIFLKGVVQLVKSDGNSPVLTAPMTFVGTTGRKVAIIIEETIWQNVWPNPDNCRDIEELEDRFLIQTPYFETYREGLPRLTAPDDDYEQMLEDIGFTAEEVEAVSNSPLFRTEMPPEWNRIAFRKSPIHGTGLFAETNFTEGEMICPMTIGDDRTPAGWLTNHAKIPNAKAVRCREGIALVALADIHGRRGGLNGQEITVDYRQVRAVVTGE